ncbi:chemotaxis protein [Kordiimonas sediminis]|uniref:Chemotaxis protein n=1 Tax=Kordiimonas sediminis TaxID=1735581 RepID=A0A919ATB2_9PROT|nr:PAS domain-containing protein [Kordiimonas sediminis]GHF24126.1 chemotaxis protein [Kordiimonas sediminis]
MAINRAVPTNEEILFGQDEIIVSKTDLKGRIIYANEVFCRVAEMTTREVIGQPHNIIRHPDMPRAVFKLLWDTISKGEEIFAYVKNMSKTGKYYWVIAHVTPSYSQLGEIDGYHSNRRLPSKSGVNDIAPAYDQLLAEERKHSNPKEALAASYALLHEMVEKNGTDYAEFIWSTGE